MISLCFLYDFFMFRRLPLRIIAVVGYGRHQLSTAAAASTSAGRLFLHEVADQCIRWDVAERPSFSLLLAPRKPFRKPFHGVKTCFLFLGTNICTKEVIS